MLSNIIMKTLTTLGGIFSCAYLGLNYKVYKQLSTKYPQVTFSPLFSYPGQLTNIPKPINITENLCSRPLIGYVYSITNTGTDFSLAFGSGSLYISITPK